MKISAKILAPAGILTLGVLGALGLIAARSDVETRPPEIPPPLVRSVLVRPDSVDLRVPAQGTVTPRTETDLISQVTGEVVYVSPNFAGGGFFSQNEVLLRIDPRDYELAVATARSQVAQAEVRLEREQEEAEVAREEWGRVGTGSPTPLVLRKPQLAEARAGLDAARAALQRARLYLERTTVRAPYEGRVRSKRVDVGQVVGPSAPLGRIYAVDYAEVRLPVPDRQLAYLDLDLHRPAGSGTQEGPGVTLASQFAGRRHTWLGRVVRVEGEIDPRTRMVHIVARIDDPYGPGSDDTPPLSVGLYVEAEIAGKRIDDAIVLPRAALRGKDQVLVIEDGRLRFRTVDVLRADEESVIVTGGLRRGERVCVSPLDAVVDGMRVRIEVGVEGSQE